eukprot:10438508-Lingulodinium_polyedra.AAC.1
MPPGGGPGPAGSAGEEEGSLGCLGAEASPGPSLEPRPAPGADFDGSLPPPAPGAPAPVWEEGGSRR